MLLHYIPEVRRVEEVRPREGQKGPLGFEAGWTDSLAPAPYAFRPAPTSTRTRGSRS